MNVAPITASDVASMQIAEMNFGLNMLRQSPASQQMVVSPLSVIFALAMVELGAKGRTKAQINQLISNGVDDDVMMNFYSALSKNITNYSVWVRARIANGLFLNKTFWIRDDYASTITKRYAAKIEVLNFKQAKKAAKVIDDFVSTTTEGKIKNIVREDALKNASFLIVNAVYFKGNWLDSFSRQSTTEDIFHHSETKEEKIAFMKEYGVYRSYAENDNVEVLSLPYRDKSYAFNVFLPKKRFGLLKLRKQLNGLKIRNLLSQLKPEFLTIHIPKMKIETNYKLKKALEHMGVTDLFTKEKANLTGISDLPLLGDFRLYVTRTAHKALIEVDEEGTTAAAPTFIAGEGLGGGPMEEPKMFVANHPFIFILTKDNNPFFIGQFA